MVDRLAVCARNALARGALALLAPALLAGATTARAQCEAATEGERVQLTFAVNQRIQELEAIKRQIEVEHHVLTIFHGGVILVTPQQVGGLYGAAVFQGVVDPDSIPSQIRTLRATTTIYLRDIIEPQLKEARACRDRLTQPPAPAAPPTPSAAASQIDWPAPMDWIAVRGMVRGTYAAECAGRLSAGYPALKSTGSYRLEFPGDGSMGGVFEDDARLYRVTGKIKGDGTAEGDARSTDPEQYYLRWTARFQRSGVDLHMPSHTLDLMAAARGPHSVLVDCKPGYMRQE